MTAEKLISFGQALLVPFIYLHPTRPLRLELQTTSNFCSFISSLYLQYCTSHYRKPGDFNPCCVANTRHFMS